MPPLPTYLNLGLVGQVALFLGAVLLARLVLGYLRFRKMELAIPGPPSLPILGNALSFASVDKAEVLDTLMDLWGGRMTLSRFAIFNKLFVFVTDPDDLCEMLTKRKDLQSKPDLFYAAFREVAPNGLVQINGDHWKFHRKVMNPAFSKSVVNRFVAVFDGAAKEYVRSVELGEEREVLLELQMMSCRMLIRTGLQRSADLEEQAMGMVKFVELFLGSANKRAWRPWLWPASVFRLTAEGRLMQSLQKPLRDLTMLGYKRRQREVSSMSPDDYAHMKSQRTSIIDVIIDPPVPLTRPFTDDEVVDEILTSFGAALETKTSVIAFVLKILSMRQDIQDKVYEELVGVFGDTDRNVEPDDLSKLCYLEQVIKETMRFFPILPILLRHVPADTEFAGYKLPKDTVLIINIFGLHRNPAIWPEPLKFDPDRFLPENVEARHRFAYLPFSAGSRNCIGGAYAMLVLLTSLAVILRAYRVDPVDDGCTDPSEVPLEFGFAIRQVGGIKVKFSERKPRPQKLES